MKELKINKKVVYNIDYDNWDRFVNDFFGLKRIKKYNTWESVEFKYEIVADEELGNDSKFEYAPNGKISDYDVENTLNPILFYKKVPNYSTRTIMDYFVQIGILDKGKTYQIEISW